VTRGSEQRCSAHDQTFLIYMCQSQRSNVRGPRRLPVCRRQVRSRRYLVAQSPKRVPTKVGFPRAP